MWMAASRPRCNMIKNVIIMGVAGCGKTSVGEALAARTDWTYLDGDTLHSRENVAKMSAGIPLTDADRWPWLETVGQTFAKSTTRLSPARLMIGCSALKRAYRDHIRAAAGAPVTFVHLSGTREIIEQRMRHRSGHFMPLALLDSQFAALEPPAVDESAFSEDIDQTLDAIVTEIAARLSQGQSTREPSNTPSGIPI
ncbi:MAG: gluconokinase [Hyphomicrobiales bacterium]|nr:gluconokinase [Hyphomicrobiales bacterium]MDE2113758.1 gluconokinase [Hyphomicrobiales bacterium]